MADITMCLGEGCPMKETCYLYKAKANEYRQSYFCSSPIKDGKCEFYWKHEESKDDRDGRGE